MDENSEETGMKKMNKFEIDSKRSLLILGLMLTTVLSLGAGAVHAAGPAPVGLGTAGNFVVLAKSGVSATGTTRIVGNVGVSPVAASSITGFGLIADSTNTFSTSSLVTGSVYAADMAPPTPSNLTTSIANMQTAYTDAAGRAADVTELGAGNIGGLTIAPGTYKWGTGVLIPSNVTLSGGPNDVWIFQIAQTLSVSSGVIVSLSGGAQPTNVFWQVAGQATLGTTSAFKGIILGQTAIVLSTGAVLNGRALAQTAVTLDANSVSVSAPVTATPPICTLTATPNMITVGMTTNLFATCSPLATSYIWSSNTGFGTSVSSGGISPTVTTTYSVTGINGGGSSNFAFATVTVSPQIDVRSFFPVAANANLMSTLRVINTGNLATPVFAARIDGATGQVGIAAQLTPSLAAGGAMTFTAQQVETALGTHLLASDLPRIRITGTASILEVQSLVENSGVWSDITGASSGSAVAVATYVPAAAAAGGYSSVLRVINTGTLATPVTVAKIDAATGITGAAATLAASLPPGAAVSYSAAQVEAALGFSIAASDRSRILVSAANSTLDVQSFLLQPDNVFSEISTSQSGTSIDVRSYVPAANSGYTSFLRIINESSTTTPITASVIDAVSGMATATATLIASLPANAAMTLTSAQVEAALGTQLAPADRPRIRVTSPAGIASLRTQSFLLQPGGVFNEISNATSGSSVKVRTYFPAANAAYGPTSYLRVINTATTSTPLILSLIDSVSGALLNSVMLTQAFPAGAAQIFTSAQIESALGIQITPPSLPNILLPRIQINGIAGLEVQNFLSQPNGIFTEISGGQ